MAAVMELEGLSKRFGDHAVLADIDLSVRPGERVAVLGLNGAGKTTLLRCLMGVLSFEGAVRIGGVNVGEDGARARSLIGYVPQRPPLFQMTLGDVVEFFSVLRDVPAERIAARLERLGMPLESSADRSLPELSGGMVQKALLAIAMASDPQVLLLDEPSANLDPRARAEFMRALQAVGGGTTILLASHRMDEVESVADRIWILHKSRIVFDGSLAELRGLAGSDGRLWIRTEPGHREALVAVLEGRGGGDVVANGTGAGMRTTPERGAAALERVRQAGIPIVDFWVERASLEEIVQRFFDRGAK